MLKTMTLSAVAFALIATASTAQAGFRFGGSSAQERWKQQQILDEAFRRAREVGGYNDPITAFKNLLNGTATEKDIRPGVNTIYDTPNFGTLQLKGRWD